MKVNNGGQGPIRPEPKRDGASTMPVGSGPHILPVRDEKQARTQRIERLDRVEISDAGRARAAKVEPVSAKRADRIAEIRQRVLEGAYNADAVVADVAKRILDRGDL